MEVDPDWSLLQLTNEKNTQKTGTRSKADHQTEIIDNEALMPELEAAREQIEELRNINQRQKQLERDEQLRLIRNERLELARQLELAKMEFANLSGSKENSVADILDVERRERDAEANELGEIRSRIETIRGSQRGSPALVGNSAVIPKVGIAAIGELLSTFEGNSGTFDSWERQVKMLKSTYNLEDDATRVLICSRLKSKALSWFHSRPEHIEMSTDQLLSEIRKMFHHQNNRILLKKEFEERMWKKGETFSEYIHEKTILANRVSVPDDERIEYYVEGIPDMNLRNQARIQRFRDLENLLAAFKKVTINSKQSSEGDKPLKTSKEETKTGGKEVHGRCYNCSKWGHMASD
ncbi:uncharacterized protein LOC122502224 [Leptopilina heterotoma]|uniref:uncharacterized protein LOC122502224 n=1 Tax=Leptopilina heterotoma TaxID=63436 RepID=UPI001CA7C49D|nr:uncharacterized protein LOC122502224 [Leptopilina heterotoma]